MENQKLLQIKKELKELIIQSRKLESMVDDYFLEEFKEKRYLNE